MKRVRELLVLILMGIIVSGTLKAQDTKISHLFMWKSFNNPGYSGFDGLANVSIGMQKSYWGKPLDFRTYFIAADYPFNDKRVFGLGGVSLFYQRDQENSLHYVTNTFAASISGRVKVSRSTVIQFGIQPALYQKSLDPSRITLGDQFDPYYGQVLNISPELVNIYADRVLLFDFGAGLYGKSDFNYQYQGVASLEYGFSVYHIIEPTQSFLSEHGSISSTQNVIERRYSAYLSYIHPLVVFPDVNTTLAPYIMYDKQGSMQNIQFGVYWEEEKYGMLGIGGRKDQYGSGLDVSTLLVHLGVYLTRVDEGGLKIGYTCEVPSNQGTMYKNTSHSLSLHWYFRKTPARCTSRFDNSPNNHRTRRSQLRRGWR